MNMCARVHRVHAVWLVKVTSGTHNTAAGGSLREYVHECLSTYTMVLAYALAIAASGLLARGCGPGTVLVRTGHVGTGIEG